MLYTLNDQQFLEQFYALSLAPEAFNHQGHLRLAWLQLQQQDLEQAIDKVATGIQCFAQSLGASDKYHATITAALVRIMAARMAAQPGQDWQTFIQHNDDLLNCAYQLLLRYYSSERLTCDAARAAELAPDLQPLPQACHR